MKKNWKESLKNIVGTLLFLTGALVMLISISYVLRPTDNGTGRWRFAGFYGEEKDTIDVVTIGSSAMYRYFNNPIFWETYNLTSYNLCSASQPVEIIGDLMDEARKEQNPQLFVVETRKFVKYSDLKTKAELLGMEEADEDEITDEESGLENIELRRVTDNMKYSRNRFEMIEQNVEGDWKEKLDYHLDIIRYHSNWENLSDMNDLKYYRNSKDNVKKGWSNIFIVKPKKPIGDLKNTEPLPIGKEAEAEITKLLEKCRKEQINVVFVSTPWVANEEQRRRNLYLGELIESYGFRFYDGNEHVEEAGIDYASDFYNGSHVNTWGSEKFTKTFGKYLVENYELDATHEKKVKKSWDECVAAYDRNLEEYAMGLLEPKEGEEQ